MHEPCSVVDLQPDGDCEGVRPGDGQLGDTRAGRGRRPEDRGARRSRARGACTLRLCSAHVAARPSGRSRVDLEQRRQPQRCRALEVRSTHDKGLPCRPGRPLRRPELHGTGCGHDLQLRELRGAEGGQDSSHEGALGGRTADDARRGRGPGRGSDTGEDDGDKHGGCTRSHTPECTPVGPGLRPGASSRGWARRSGRRRVRGRSRPGRGRPRRRTVRSRGSPSPPTPPTPPPCR